MSTGAIGASTPSKGSSTTATAGNGMSALLDTEKKRKRNRDASEHADDSEPAAVKRRPRPYICKPTVPPTEFYDKLANEQSRRSKGKANHEGRQRRAYCRINHKAK